MSNFDTSARILRAVPIEGLALVAIVGVPLALIKAWGWTPVWACVVGVPAGLLLCALFVLALMHLVFGVEMLWVIGRRRFRGWRQRRARR